MSGETLGFHIWTINRYQTLLFETKSRSPSILNFQSGFKTPFYFLVENFRFQNRDLHETFRHVGGPHRKRPGRNGNVAERGARKRMVECGTRCVSGARTLGFSYLAYGFFLFFSFFFINWKRPGSGERQPESAVARRQQHQRLTARSCERRRFRGLFFFWSILFSRSVSFPVEARSMKRTSKPNAVVVTTVWPSSRIRLFDYFVWVFVVIVVCAVGCRAVVLWHLRGRLSPVKSEIEPRYLVGAAAPILRQFDLAVLFDRPWWKSGHPIHLGSFEPQQQQQQQRRRPSARDVAKGFSFFRPRRSLWRFGLVLVSPLQPPPETKSRRSISRSVVSTPFLVTVFFCRRLWKRKKIPASSKDSTRRKRRRPARVKRLTPEWARGCWKLTEPSGFDLWLGFIFISAALMIGPHSVRPVRRRYCACNLI